MPLLKALITILKIIFMARKKTAKKKSAKKSQRKVKKVMHEYKEGTLKSGRSKKKVTSRKQAIAIGLSEARKEGAKIPQKKDSKKEK